MIASELQVWRDTEKLVSYLLDISIKFPKAYKFTLGQKMTNTSLDLFEYIQLANMVAKEDAGRKKYLQGFQVKFELLKILVKLGVEKKIITLKQEASLTCMMVGIGKQISAWKNR